MEEVIPFDWHRILLGNNEPPLFLLEIAFRSLVMYLFILGALRITGKRGVKQLSLFELTIILGLGSAAGDPMFYEDVPLLHALAVFAVVVLSYVGFNRLTEINTSVEKLLEGETVCILEQGVISLAAFKKQNLTYAEFFGEMREKQVEHLGQVRKVYLEANGELSIFFFPDDDVKPGLPIFPEILASAFTTVTGPGQYSCFTCGRVAYLEPAKESHCSNCGRNKWLPACTTKREA